MNKKEKIIRYLLNIIVAMSVGYILMQFTYKETPNYLNTFYLSFFPLALSLGLSIWKRLLKHYLRVFVVSGLVLICGIIYAFIYKDNSMFMGLTIFNLIISMMLMTYYSVIRKME